MSIKYLDAKRLRRILIGGANWLKKHEEELNELNVYPVPDGDTGSNMAMTVDTMAKDIQNLTDKKTDMKDLTEIVEEAVLMGARGNSGTILSQIITGFLKGTDNKKRLMTEDVYKAFLSAKEQAYKAVETPIEGTMLTVIREIAENSEKIYKETEFLDVMMEKLVEGAKISVEKTPDLLPKLKEANVVDSGAKGLYYFFEGAYKTITEINMLFNLSQEDREYNKKISDVSHSTEDIKHVYCTEFIISGIKEDVEKLKKELLDLGDSVVFAQTSKKFKTHIHTNNPGLALEKALSYGYLEKVKIENMKLQNEAFQNSDINTSKVYINNNNKNKNISNKKAYIVVADTEELKDIFLQKGADVVILGGQSKNPSVQDFYEAINKIDENKEIVILPNNKNIILTVKIAVEKLDQDILVAETKTMLEGYYYLIYKNEDIDYIKKSMKNNYSIEITRSVKDTKINGLEIKENDYIAIVNGKIEFNNVEIADLYDELAKKYITDDTVNVTVVEGINKSESLDLRFDKLKEDLYGFFEIIKTKQDIYNYYILIENKDKNLPEIAIVTDSSCDLVPKDIKNEDIYIVPLKVEIDKKIYFENINLTKNNIWELLNESYDVKSAQPSPKSLINIYNYLIRKGYKKILSLHISKGLSGTYQTANMARQNCKEPDAVEVIDTKAVGAYLGFMLLELSKRIKQGQKIDKLKYYIEEYKKKAKIFVYMENLNRAEKGGRISKSSKFAATLLNIKPIITMIDGKLVVCAKTFGEQNAVKYIQKEISEYSKKYNLHVLGTWGGSSKMNDIKLNILDSLKNNNRINIVNDYNFVVGSAIGVHSGPMVGLLLVPRVL